eukprot:scaffold27145_cov61-Phaeocystis_antarctica.AAC.1
MASSHVKVLTTKPATAYSANSSHEVGTTTTMKSLHSTASSQPAPRIAARNLATSLAVEPSFVLSSSSSSAAASPCVGCPAQTYEEALAVASASRRPAALSPPIPPRRMLSRRWATTEGRAPTLATECGRVRLMGTARFSTLSAAPACRSEKETSGPAVERLARITPTASSSVPCPAALSSFIIPGGSVTSTGVLAVSHAKGVSPSSLAGDTESVRLRLAVRSVRGGGGGALILVLPATDGAAAMVMRLSMARAASEMAADCTDFAAAVALALSPTSPPPTRLLSAEVAATAVLSPTVSVAESSAPTRSAPAVSAATTSSFSACAAALASASPSAVPSEAVGRGAGAAEKESISEATVSSTAVATAGGSDGGGAAGGAVDPGGSEGAAAPPPAP